MTKIFLLCLGWICVALGIIGAFLPLLPTTPFLLVAVWAFAQSSPRFKQWLLTHPRLGPYVRDWHDHRAIPMSAKVLSITMMSLSLTWLVLWSGAPTFVILGVALCLACVAFFILSRPTHPKSDSP